MDILYMLIGVSVLALGAVGAAFVWAVRDGQFDDLTGPAYRVLGDEDEHGPPAGGGEDGTERSGPR